MTQLEDQAEGLRVVRREEIARVIPLRRRGEGSRLRRVAVTSGKGGVGKTQVSANLAIVMANSGLRVLLMDADLGLASLDLALGVRPQDDLRAVVRGERSVRDVLVGGPCGIQLIPACPGRYDMANLSLNERRRLTLAIDEAASDFDVLIVDTGAGIGSNAVAFASSADDVLLVATPDPTSMRDAYAMAKVLHRRSGVDRINLVANQVESEIQGAELHQTIQRIAARFMTLQISYLGCIPFDESVRQGVVEGQPCVLSDPSCAASRAFELLVHRLNPQAPDPQSSREPC